MKRIRGQQRSHAASAMPVWLHLDARPLALALIGALALAAHATDRLAAATGLDLVPSCVTAARAALAKFGGTAKTTGAGGGDVGVAVIPASADAALATDLLREAGCRPHKIALDDHGVDLRAAS